MEFPSPELLPEPGGAVGNAARRACLCFAQQMLADDHTKLPRTSRRILAGVLSEAGIDAGPNDQGTSLDTGR